MNDVLLESRNLCRSYPEGEQRLEVLKGIDLKVSRGDIVFVVGHSGAGKSTLLHLLGALDKPTEGEVYLHEMDIYRMPERERSKLRNEKIGFIFQFYHLLPEFYAWENVAMPALIAAGSLSWSGRKSGLVKDKAVDMLKEVGLEQRVNHRPNQLSGGEEQRVAIARALINEPEIVFADEPTGNLDVENSRAIIQLIRKLNESRQQTFVMATHQEELAEEGDRLLRIVDGKVREER